MLTEVRCSGVLLGDLVYYSSFHLFVCNGKVDDGHLQVAEVIKGLCMLNRMLNIGLGISLPHPFHLH